MMNGSAYGIKFESDDGSSLGGGGGVSGVPSSSAGNADAAAASQYDAAEAAVARLGSLMGGTFHGGPGGGTAPHASLKRKEPEAAPSGQDGASPAAKKGKKPLTNERREERNLREKERSLKITEQIHELRNLLSAGGVIVPKGTKSTILTECANYIRLLQQHQVRSEMDKAQLVQEVQRIGNGAIGEKAAYAIRHAAAQNGVSSLANLPEGGPASTDPQQPQAPTDPLSDNLGDREYRSVFNSCSVGIAIATMGGSFIDCNLAFTQLSSYTKRELKAMTIFNITSRDDLQGAFDMMSQLITPASCGGELNADGGGGGGNGADDGSGGGGSKQSPVILRSAIRHRSDLGLSVSLIRGEDGIARYFNVTLVKLPPSPLGGMGGPTTVGMGRPIPATAEMGQPAALPNAVPQPQMQQLGGFMPQSAAMHPAPTAGAGVMKQQGFQGLHTPQYTAG